MKIRLTQLTNSLNIPHMKYSRLLTAIMMLTGVLTACSDQENEQDGANERTALSINAGIGVIPARHILCNHPCHRCFLASE